MAHCKCAFAPLLLQIHTKNKVTFPPKKKNIQQILFFPPKNMIIMPLCDTPSKHFCYIFELPAFSCIRFTLPIFTSADPLWLKNDIANWRWTFFQYKYALLL